MGNCKCAYCGNNLPFELPTELITAVLEKDLVIFAGAGVSTETRKVFNHTLYDEVADELGLEKKSLPDFPTLMSMYCKKANGRQKLLRKIKSRFDYCQQYAILYDSATSFHRELSSIHYIETIITTNWDDFFETECKCIPFVTAQDFAFHSMSGRKVYKIHGSINNYGTIIATKEDYDFCYKELNKGVLGGHLKSILSTKTIVFIGYSFRDYDFSRIYNYLRKELKDLIPHIYVVTLDEKIKYNDQYTTVIKTDATYFISTIRQHLEGSKVLIERSKKAEVYKIWNKFSTIKLATSSQGFKVKQPSIYYCVFYQDGFRHALEFLLHNASAGSSFDINFLMQSIKVYEIKRSNKLKSKDYPDVAYIDGYIQGLQIMLSEKINFKSIPFWYLFGIGPIVDKRKYFDAIENYKVYHKEAEKIGQKVFRDALHDNSGIIYHRSPFL